MPATASSIPLGPIPASGAASMQAPNLPVSGNHSTPPGASVVQAIGNPISPGGATTNTAPAGSVQTQPATSPSSLSHGSVILPLPAPSIRKVDWLQIVVATTGVAISVLAVAYGLKSYQASVRAIAIASEANSLARMESCRTHPVSVMVA